MSGEDTWNKDIMLGKLKHLNSLEKHAVGGLMQFANKKGVNIDTKDIEALNKITAETPLTHKNLTKEQQKLINIVYDKLPAAPQWNFDPKGGKRRRKSRKKTKKKTNKKRKKKTNKKRRYKHTGGNKCKCCKCCKKRKPKKKSRKRR